MRPAYSHGLSITAQFFVVSILILRAFERHNSIDTKEELLSNVYDYIVVGSGSAGAVVAHRLAEDGKTSVLLLEAGGPAGVVNDIPGQATTILNFGSRYDWNYTMAPQPWGQGFLNHVIPETRGFVIGGTSTINTMIFNRGNMRDYDNWATKYGAVGWSYADVLPFFTKYEANRDPHIVAASPGFHGTTGPIGITSWAHPDPLMLLHQQYLNKEAGIPTTDINGPNQLGTGFAQAFIEMNGVRSSASNAYIDPNPFPHNLHILSNALVTQILFEHNRAVGVVYERNGHRYSVQAKKEVIVSAGVVGSPQLLQLSGVGPKELLEQMHIPLVKDLPVGDNYQNHPGVLFQIMIKQASQKLLNIPGALTVPQLYQWLKGGTGPLAAHHRAVTYINTATNKDDLAWPSAAWETCVYSFLENVNDYRQFLFQDQKAWFKYLSQFSGRQYLFIHGLVQRSRSKGYVQIQSTNPHIQPIIQANFLKDPLDYQDLFETIQKIFYFYETSSMAQHLEPFRPIPGCSRCPGKHVYECDAYIHCHIEQALYSAYHPCCTNRMGDPHRHDTVVDPKLRVKGIEGLRVCDASIIPQIQNSNTNAASLMIGEKCAHHIKEDNGHSYESYGKKQDLYHSGDQVHTSYFEMLKK